MVLALLGWIAVGLVVGFLGTKVVNLQGDTPLFAVSVAVAGAIVGGLGHAYFSGEGVMAWNTMGVLVSAGAAVVATAIFHIIRSRTITRESHTVRSSW